MECEQTDLKKVLNSTPKVKLDEKGIKTILYNMLCCINYLHSANVVHRDIKPANFLINNKCKVSICDLGMARVMPAKTEADKELKQTRKEVWKKNVTPTIKDSSAYTTEDK